MTKAARYNLFGTLLICLLGLLVYSNTFGVPLVFDDAHVIVTNQNIQTLSRVDRIFWHSPKRFLPFLSFAINFHLHQTEVAGYHMVNLAVHLLASLAVWRLARQIFRNPAAGVGEGSAIGPDLMALFSALIFLAHPVQTQAVTYITQRMASMAGLFYLTSVWLYGKAREVSNVGFQVSGEKESAPEGPRRVAGGAATGKRAQSNCVLKGRGTWNGRAEVGSQRSEVGSPTDDHDYRKSNQTHGPTVQRSFYLLSLLSALAAVHCKETALSLPAAIMLYELCFGQRRCKRDWLPALPFIAVAALIPLYHVGSALLASFQTAPAETVNQVAALTQETKAISRLDYIFTEFRVLVTYLRLLVLPVNQTLDYDYPVYHSLFQLPVLLSFLTLSALGLSAILSFRRCRIWTFAVFWFFITLSVESGLIPIMDVIYEHRLYPAVLAYALLLPWGLEWLLGRIKTSGF